MGDRILPLEKGTANKEREKAILNPGCNWSFCIELLVVNIDRKTEKTDVIVCTHTYIPWFHLPRGPRFLSSVPERAWNKSTLRTQILDSKYSYPKKGTVGVGMYLIPWLDWRKYKIWNILFSDKVRKCSENDRGVSTDIEARFMRIPLAKYGKTWASK